MRQLDPDYSIRPLVLSVIVQAALDARGSDLTKALDGMIFLKGGNYPFFVEGLGSEYADTPPEFWLEIPLRKLYTIRMRMDYQKYKE